MRHHVASSCSEKQSAHDASEARIMQNESIPSTLPTFLPAGVVRYLTKCSLRRYFSPLKTLRRFWEAEKFHPDGPSHFFHFSGGPVICFLFVLICYIYGENEISYATQKTATLLNCVFRLCYDYYEKRVNWKLTEVKLERNIDV